MLAHTKDLRDLVGGETRESQLAGALEDLVDWEIAPEDEIAAVLDLIQRVVTMQGDSGPFLLRELRTQDKRPVIQTLTNYLVAEPIGGRLQGLQVGGRQEGIIIL
ncbi:MAG TPA: hypothetical protein VES69_04070, partial [Pyrinomonadaceae bacterium]|nr:hypothetical protein [Pyrinomonadaceae bacterium]